MHGARRAVRLLQVLLLEGDDVSTTGIHVRLARLRAGGGLHAAVPGHVYEDVTIELLNYDEDMIRSGLRSRRRPPPSRDQPGDA